MLRHKGLFDPIQRTQEMKPGEFLKYVEICDRQPEMTQTRAELVDEIHKIFYDSHKKTEKQHLDRIWAAVGNALAKNEGLAQFTLDYDGARSDFFFPWLMEIVASPSSALEMAYNAGRNLEGDWVVNVPESDAINFFVRNDPTFVYNRERQLFVADLAMSSRDLADAKHKSKVVDFGAGRLAWARWHGFEFKPNLQTLLAFDMDQTVDANKLFDKKPADLGVKYENKNFLTELNNPECFGANLVILGGVASYYPMEMFSEKAIRPIYDLLEPGGVFFFDLQLNCPYYQRSMKIFGWPEMRLPNTAAEAIEMVESVRKKFWQSGLRLSAEYALDTYNEVPSSVMVVLTKI